MINRINYVSFKAVYIYYQMLYQNVKTPSLTDSGGVAVITVSKILILLYAVDKAFSMPMVQAEFQLTIHLLLS